jgi:quinol monooxygenase YgiN
VSNGENVVMVKSTQIVVLATAKERQGKEAELQQAMLDVAAPTRAQQGCLQFELYRSAHDPAAITAFERWSSLEDHERHLRGDHVKALIAKLGGLLAGPPELVIMRPL